MARSRSSRRSVSQRTLSRHRRAAHRIRCPPNDRDSLPQMGPGRSHDRCQAPLSRGSARAIPSRLGSADRNPRSPDSGSRGPANPARALLIHGASGLRRSGRFPRVPLPLRNRTATLPRSPTPTTASEQTDHSRPRPSRAPRRATTSSAGSALSARRPTGCKSERDCRFVPPSGNCVG
jgi:hypothetical protein